MSDEYALPQLRPACICYKNFVCDPCRTWEHTKLDRHHSKNVVLTVYRAKYARLAKRHLKVRYRIRELEAIEVKTEKTLHDIQKLSQERKALWKELQILNTLKNEEKRRTPLVQ